MTDRVDIGDWCTLYHADATEILDVLREHAPNAVIMDPPYGLKLTGLGTGQRKPNVKHPRHNEKRAREPFHGDREAANLQPWFDFAPDVVLWGADHLREQLPSGGRFLGWSRGCNRGDHSLISNTRGGKAPLA